MYQTGLLLIIILNMCVYNNNRTECVMDCSKIFFYCLQFNFHKKITFERNALKNG